MDEAKLISANGISRVYGNLVAVDSINFSLKQGEILGFLGPNGAGKTTTMSILTGNLAPHSGSISICGTDLLENPKAAKSKIGYLPEIPPLYPQLTVTEYLTYCANIHDINKVDVKYAVERALQRCNIQDVSKKLIGNLSKGFQQRVGIAQAIIHSPQVVILDEPTVGLDPTQIIEIRELIANLGKECGIIISTHILPEVEEICNRILIMNSGKLVFESELPLKHSPSVAVGFTAPPTITQLQQEFEDIEVMQKSKHRFIFSPKFDYEFKPKLAQAAVKNNWGLEELRSIQPSLENIFTSYVCSDAGSEQLKNDHNEAKQAENNNED